MYVVFFLLCYGYHRDLHVLTHSFPTRRSSDFMHYALTTEPNPADAGAALDASPSWTQVEPGSEEDEQLRESVVELVSGAANVSDWAVALGEIGRAHV